MHNGYARKAVSELQTLIKEEKGKDTFLMQLLRLRRISI